MLRNLTVYNTGCLVFFFFFPRMQHDIRCRNGIQHACNILQCCLNMAKHCISTLFLLPSLDQQLTLAKRPQNKVKHTTSLSWFAFSDNLLQKRPSQDGQRQKALKWPTQTGSLREKILRGTRHCFKKQLAIKAKRRENSQVSQ